MATRDPSRLDPAIENAIRDFDLRALAAFAEYIKAHKRALAELRAELVAVAKRKGN